MLCIRDACVPPAAAALRLERRLRWHVRALPWWCDLIEITAPNGFRFAACSNAPGVSCISADLRAPGRPWVTAVALHLERQEALIATALQVEPPMCRLGMGWPATRAAGRSAADSGRTDSAGSGFIGSIMCAPWYASNHYPNRPSPQPILSASGHQAHMLLRDACGCGGVSATRCSCSRTLAARL